MYYAEIRQHLSRVGPPKFIPVKDLDQFTGHRGLYLYTQEQAAEITKRRSVKGLSELSVYADELFVEFDDNKEMSLYFYRYLRKQDAIFSIWDSGNRSQHFHIKIEPMEGAETPWSHKKWVEQNAPGADTALYHHAGSIRLPGTYHAKNPGSFKHILFNKTEGQLLSVVKQKKTVADLDNVSDDPDLAFEIYLRMLRKPVGEGNRTPTMYRLFKLAVDAGVDYDTFEADILDWNTRKCVPPHTDQHMVNWLIASWGTK